MKLPIYQIDAFCQHRFAGNPAAVIPLQRWLDDELMLRIAAENNLSETAFICPDTDKGDFDIRWFAPTQEIDLCGHATLASAWVLYHRLQWHKPEVRFHSRSGELKVTREREGLSLDFPARPAAPMSAPEALVRALGARNVVYSGRSRDWLLVLNSEAEVAQLAPDFRALQLASDRAVIVSAPGDSCDFVSRFFAPTLGLDEDPVTGSAHCTLVPYWAQRLDQPRLQARQISQRQGELLCHLRGTGDQARVSMLGQAVLYLEGTVEL